MSDALRIARHEWRLVLKEPRFLFPFLFTPLILLGLQAVNLWGIAGTRSESFLLARTLLLTLAVMAPASSVPLGADSFAGERERNTLEILMCLPTGMGALFWGKILGMLPFPILLGWLGQAMLGGLLAVRGSWTPEFGVLQAKAMALTPATSLLLCSLATWLSMVAESVRGAAQLSGLAMLGLFLLTTIFAPAYFNSALVMAGSLAFLLAASAVCFLAARRRFPKVL
jgi:ABC-type transport system involved in multi-copper enzyme maturation permease subunit